MCLPEMPAQEARPEADQVGKDQAGAACAVTSSQRSLRSMENIAMARPPQIALPQPEESDFFLSEPPVVRVSK